jgi:hypothetical protein
VTSHLTRLTSLWPAFRGSSGVAPSPPPGLPLWFLLLCGGGRGTPLPYDLLEAAVLRLRADAAAVAACPGGFHSGLTPAEDARAGAYCELMEVGETRAWWSGGTSIPEGILQISTFSASRAAARRAGDAVEAALFDAHLVFETGAIYSLRPAAPRMMLAPRDPTLGGANLFRDVRQFAYMTVSPP